MVPGWRKECVTVFDEKWRQHTGCLRDWHACGVSIGTARAVIKEYGRRGAGTSRLPEISFEADLSAGKLYRLRNHRLLGLAQSGQRKQQEARQPTLDSHGLGDLRCTDIPQLSKGDGVQTLLVIVGSQVLWVLQYWT